MSIKNTIGLLLLIAACTTEVRQPENVHLNQEEAITPTPVVCHLEDSIRDAGLVDVQFVNPDIRVYLRYSTRNNFLKKEMYGCLDHAYLQTMAAQKLDTAQQLLSGVDSNLHLLVWDAARPRSVQWKMWNTLQMPFNEKKRFVSNPKNGSIHNYGCAVDLTLCTSSGELLDMGTDFDYFGKAASASDEWELVQEKVLTEEQFDNRKLLRNVMLKAGFTTINSEWWHFNAMSRPEASAAYAILE